VLLFGFRSLLVEVLNGRVGLVPCLGMSEVTVCHTEDMLDKSKLDISKSQNVSF